MYLMVFLPQNIFYRKFFNPKTSFNLEKGIEMKIINLSIIFLFLIFVLFFSPLILAKIPIYSNNQIFSKNIQLNSINNPFIINLGLEGDIINKKIQIPIQEISSSKSCSTISKSNILYSP